MIDHTFVAKWRRIAWPSVLTALVAAVAATIAFLPQS